MLTDRAWKLKYTPDDGGLVEVFYVPALQDASRCDRLTGYFDAGALALAARGVDGLVRNDGRMRMVVGCTLAPAEIDAHQQERSTARLASRRTSSNCIGTARRRSGRRRWSCSGG